MEMPEFHRRILDASLEVCHLHGLVLAGGYGMRAHGLVERPSQDLDFATFSSVPLAAVTQTLADTYREYGFEVENLRGTNLLARLIVSEPGTGQACAVDLMKLPLQKPPVMMEIGPVASVEDMVGMKVAAVHGRGLPRDFIDVASVSDYYSFVELERLGGLFEEGFRLDNIASHLEQAMTLDGSRFTEYGLDPEQLGRLRRFLLAWYEDLSMRLAEAAHLDPAATGDGGPDRR